MRCPKCDHEQRDTSECEACGVIFSRYRVVQRRKKDEEAEKVLLRKKNLGRVVQFFQIIALVAVGASAMYYYTSIRKGSEPERSAAETIAVKQNTNAQQKAASVKSESRTIAASSISPPRGNGIEFARKATVSIETPWGNGSGFFVTENYIVTNRHVIEFDKNKIAEFREKVETARRLIDLEREKLRDMRRELQGLARGPSRSQLALIIEARQKELNKILPQQEKGEEKLEQLDRDMQPSDIKVILADDSEHSASYVLISDEYDLALMSLFSGEYPFLSRPPAGKKLQQGEKVYRFSDPHFQSYIVVLELFYPYSGKNKFLKCFPKQYHGKIKTYLKEKRIRIRKVTNQEMKSLMVFINQLSDHED